jgi:hypothetical protein
MKKKHYNPSQAALLKKVLLWVPVLVRIIDIIIRLTNDYGRKLVR